MAPILFQCFFDKKRIKATKIKVYFLSNKYGSLVDAIKSPLNQCGKEGILFESWQYFHKNNNKLIVVLFFF